MSSRETNVVPYQLGDVIARDGVGPTYEIVKIQGAITIKSLTWNQLLNGSYAPEILERLGYVVVER